MFTKTLITLTTLSVSITAHAYSVPDWKPDFDGKFNPDDHIFIPGDRLEQGLEELTDEVVAVEVEHEHERLDHRQPLEQLGGRLARRERELDDGLGRLVGVHADHNGAVAPQPRVARDEIRVEELEQLAV